MVFYSALGTLNSQWDQKYIWNLNWEKMVREKLEKGETRLFYAQGGLP